MFFVLPNLNSKINIMRNLVFNKLVFKTQQISINLNIIKKIYYRDEVLKIQVV
jgi:hypothetical protein